MEIQDPCEECGGSGKAVCGRCNGRQRVNLPGEAMLPSGQWPHWCPRCRGSGSDWCVRCNGTGEHREAMGFMVPSIGDEERGEVEVKVVENRPW